MLLYQVLASTRQHKYKKVIQNNKFNEKFELPEGSSSVLDIQNYFEYIIKMKQ